MKYVYFVSYNHPGGVGSLEIVSLFPFTKLDHIRGAEAEINETTRNNWTAINNFILLRTEE